MVIGHSVQASAAEEYRGRCWDLREVESLRIFVAGGREAASKRRKSEAHFELPSNAFHLLLFFLFPSHRNYGARLSISSIFFRPRIRQSPSTRRNGGNGRPGPPPPPRTDLSAVLAARSRSAPSKERRQRISRGPLRRSELIGRRAPLHYLRTSSFSPRDRHLSRMASPPILISRQPHRSQTSTGSRYLPWSFLLFSSLETFARTHGRTTPEMWTSSSLLPPLLLFSLVVSLLPQPSFPLISRRLLDHPPTSFATHRARRLRLPPHLGDQNLDPSLPPSRTRLDRRLPFPGIPRRLKPRCGRSSHLFETVWIERWREWVA